MRLYDTSRREIVDFSPGDDVKMYVCGVTPYDATHLGHAFTFVAYDVLQRRLVDMGHSVRCVRNVTDVDDPLFARARERGVHYLDLAAREEARFDADMQALDTLPVYSAPRASSAIGDIRRFVAAAIERGHAYASGDAVYFDVSTFPDFGALSHHDAATMLALAAERGGRPDDPHKRNPLDFVLWQPSAPDEPSWETAWGPGRPGWHVECSALALRELGATIDLHGGGSDLVFPHHECERAQSESVTGVPFVRHWMHVAMVGMDGHKMSKSRGNLVFVDALRREWDARAVRLLLVTHHYRREWEWHAGLPREATERLAAWRTAAGGDVRGAERVLDEVRLALDDDLDTPGAVRAIDDAARAGADVTCAAALLGVNLTAPVGPAS